jgi:hypothetical protein
MLRVFKEDRHKWADESTMDSIKIGKKKSGRLLDGRTWDEYPEVA